MRFWCSLFGHRFRPAAWPEWMHPFWARDHIVEGYWFEMHGEACSRCGAQRLR